MSVGKGRWQLPHNVAGENMKWLQLWEIAWQFFKRFNMELLQDFSSTLRYVVRNQSRYLCRNLYTNIQNTLKHGNNSNSHQLGNR